MKKLIALFVALVAVLGLAACGSKTTAKAPETTKAPVTTVAQKTFAHDGTYVAFAYDYNYGAPQVNEVRLTIKNDKVESLVINATQSHLDSEAGHYVWNEKSKKELGYGYHMFYSAYKNEAGEEASEAGYEAWCKANNKLEWFEQAALIEAALKADVNAKYDEIASVSIADNHYTELAKQAYANAVAGKLVDYVLCDNHGVCQIVWAEATVKADGSVSDYLVNTIQAKEATVEEKLTFTWNEKSKQELGYGYHMFYSAYKNEAGEEASEAGYEAWCKANNKLEWFEQAALICSAFAANNQVTEVAGVTISLTNELAALVKVAALVK